MSAIYMRSKENTPQGKLLGLLSYLDFYCKVHSEFWKENQVAFEQGMLQHGPASKYST